MRKLLAISFLFSTLVSTSYAEPIPAWSKGRKVADILSTSTLTTSIGLDTIHSFRQDDRKRALIDQALRTGLTVAVSEIVKRVVHRERPDGSDNRSFFSEHSALSIASTGWDVRFSIPLSLSTGYLRTAAAKHYVSDVLVGLGAGLGAKLLVEKVRGSGLGSGTVVEQRNLPNHEPTR